MPIDIDRLTEEELRDLHHRITERLRLISQVRAHGAMMNFSLGDRVAFSADGRRVVGVLTRYNRRTVTVIADDGHRWNVAPGLLTRVAPERSREPEVVAHPPPGPAVVTPQDRKRAEILARLGRAGGIP